MDQFLGDPAHRLDLWLERGQIQVLNNRVIVHGRTPYEDQDEPERAAISSGSGSARATAATSAARRSDEARALLEEHLDVGMTESF